MSLNMPYLKNKYLRYPILNGLNMGYRYELFICLGRLVCVLVCL